MSESSSTGLPPIAAEMTSLDLASDNSQFNVSGHWADLSLFGGKMAAIHNLRQSMKFLDLHMVYSSPRMSSGTKEALESVYEYLPLHTLYLPLNCFRSYLLPVIVDDDIPFGSVEYRNDRKQFVFDNVCGISTIADVATS